MSDASPFIKAEPISKDLQRVLLSLLYQKIKTPAPKYKMKRQPKRTQKILP